jgi:hypothetical protein
MNTITGAITERFYVRNECQQWMSTADEISPVVLTAVNAFFDEDEPIAGWETDFSTKYRWGPQDNSYVVTFHHHHVDGLTNYLEFKGEDNMSHLVFGTSIMVFGGRMETLPTAIKRT